MCPGMIHANLKTVFTPGEGANVGGRGQLGL